MVTQQEVQLRQSPGSSLGGASPGPPAASVPSGSGQTFPLQLQQPDRALPTFRSTAVSILWKNIA